MRSDESDRVRHLFPGFTKGKSTEVVSRVANG